MLNIKEQQLLLAEARRAVQAHLLNSVFTALDAGTDSLRQRCGVFVSLHVNKALRGCTGFIQSSLPLIGAVPHCAVTAATEDPRFACLRLEELAVTCFEISVLSPPQTTAVPTRLRIGCDGIIISRGTQKGLLLPQVAPQNGFSVGEFLAAGCLKAGLPEESWNDADVSVELFTAQVFRETSDAFRGGSHLNPGVSGP